MIINHIFRQGEEHRYAYDFETLGAMLRKAGFATIRRASYQDSQDPQLCDDQPVHQAYSLYVEAVKS